MIMIGLFCRAGFSRGCQGSLRTFVRAKFYQAKYRSSGAIVVIEKHQNIKNETMLKTILPSPPRTKPSQKLI